MSVFSLKKVNDVYDIYIDKGSIAIKTDNDKIAQAIQTRLRTFMGEYFLNKDYGIPYFQTIMKKSSSRAYFDAVLKSNISAVDGVKKISYYLGEIGGLRNYNVTFTVLDADGLEISDTFTFGD